MRFIVLFGNSLIVSVRDFKFMPFLIHIVVYVGLATK